MQQTASGLSTRVSGLFAVHFLGMGLFLPFFPLVLAARSLSVSEIGVILGLATAARIAAGPILTGLSDRTGRRRLSILGYSLAGVATLILFAATSGYPATLAAVVCLMIFWSPIVPLADAYALDVVREDGGDYGRMRLWGSIAFIVANLAGGWVIAAWSTLPIVAGILFSLLATGVVAATLPPMHRGQRNEAAGQGAKPAVLARPWFLGALAVIGLLQGSHAAYYAFGTIFWRDTGVAEAAIGVLWSLGVVTEIALFSFAGRLPAWIGPIQLLAIGALAAVLRWALFPLAVAPVPMAVLQGLHGLSFGAVHLGTVGFLSQVVPARWAATGQSLAATSTGILMAAGMAACGPLYAAAPEWAFWAMSLSSAAALGGLAVVKGRMQRAMEAKDGPASQPQSAGSGG
ncbi:MFS transporter [Polymorphum gilvum]|uniref:Permease of the major facilitator superfamily protein n=1 Tax=Polymorphum gilvum (strain LMG 25793 / CGMCC 1.9160 / SL003B-26A1) TaxID=991905 RepID=F2J3B1_POLGS|nr:MFS transporter [Polymorphum gilvum]ADZ69918.1 Permease of the major facilitator superfamily protein [Polymorphum gilvum SL003B-26A1]